MTIVSESPKQSFFMLSPSYTHATLSMRALDASSLTCCADCSKPAFLLSHESLTLLLGDRYQTQMFRYGQRQHETPEVHLV